MFCFVIAYLHSYVIFFTYIILMKRPDLKLQYMRRGSQLSSLIERIGNETCFGILLFNNTCKNTAIVQKKADITPNYKLKHLTGQHDYITIVSLNKADTTQNTRKH